MRRFGLALVAACSVSLLAASLVDHPAAVWGAAAAAALLPVALVAFAAPAAVGPRRGILVVVLVLLALLLGAGLLGLLALAGRPTVWLGPLPLAAVLQWLVLGLAPLPLVAIGYALTFDRAGAGDGR